MNPGYIKNIPKVTYLVNNQHLNEKNLYSVYSLPRTRFIYICLFAPHSQSQSLKPVFVSARCSRLAMPCHRDKIHGLCSDMTSHGTTLRRSSRSSMIEFDDRVDGQPVILTINSKSLIIEMLIGICVQYETG